MKTLRAGQNNFLKYRFHQHLYIIIPNTEKSVRHRINAPKKLKVNL